MNQDHPVDKKILLHTCCAPCSSAIIEYLLSKKIRPTLFFYNPNIFPEEEYTVRKNEIKKYAEHLGITFIDGDYDHDHWLEKIKGYEKEPERGERCLLCFKIRLLATAALAKEKNFDVITTTLASSRWKRLDQIEEAGKWAVAKFSPVSFWNKNWKKDGLSERRQVLLRENNFYNQPYCGCEFSLRTKETN